MRVRQLRNIGISAHIDSGKTTLTERILYYAGRIHRMNEVRGAGAGAKMDHQPLEKEKGITISSAATQVQWDDTWINIIDTPGHVDFTIEVERALRVLDGAILVLCSVGGVQSQSVTVDRQMRRHKVPRVAFINKMDRDGASASRVLAELRSTLNLNAALVQMPFGSGAGFAGVIDLIEMKAVRNEGEHGERVREDVVPSGLLDEAKELRAQLVETLADEHDGVLEALVEGRSVAAELLHQAIRESVLRRSFVPVLVGSAMKNTGVQPLLDAIVRYLPSPLEAEPQCAVAGDSESALELSADSEKPVVALAFKSVEDDHGALTYLRVYQGTLEKGQVVVNTTTGERLKVGRLVRMHADEKTEVRSATAGDIVALVGGRAASGDTLASPELSRLTLESLEVPNCVISLALSPADHESADRMARVLARFSREDPTLRVSSDPESGQTLISGMGELYLEVAIEKMRRDHGVELRVGQPRVSFREAIKRRAEFSYLLRKQTGGSGQFARVVGYVEPLDEFSGFEFLDRTKGGAIPDQYVSACEAGAQDAMNDGPSAGYPVVGIRVVLTDGETHSKDSSELAFRSAMRMAVREALPQARIGVLEPLMRLVVETPREFQGAVLGDLGRRRSVVKYSETVAEQTRIVAEVPLARVFGYATDLRSSTKGAADFSLEFGRYDWAPESLAHTVTK